MLMPVDQLLTYYKSSESNALLIDRMAALESLIRKVTNNNFQNRNVRLECSSGSVLNGQSHYLKVGDTVEISASGLNDGLYVVTAIPDDGTTVLDRALYACDYQVVTMVVYPKDLLLGAVQLLKWDDTQRAKVGIASETISRHTVSYVANAVSGAGGYPQAMLDFLKPYMKARF